MIFSMITTGDLSLGIAAVVVAWLLLALVLRSGRRGDRR